MVASSDHRMGSSGDARWAKLNSLTRSTLQSVKISSPEFGIGRHPNNDLHITDTRLSGYHCRIERSICPKSGIMLIHLIDLSTNGTYINGQLVGKNKRTNLKNGDEIHLLVEDATAGIAAQDEIAMVFVVL